MKQFFALLIGFLFANGLAVGGMTQPHVVRGFLDLFGNWNPALVGVMAGAITVYSLVFFLLVKKRKRPLLDSQFYLPQRSDFEPSLIAGATLFGLGWGWSGICPAPALVGLASFEPAFLVFTVSMLLAMLAFKAWKPQK